MEESRATDVQPHTSTLTATRFFRPLAVSTNFQEPATLSFLDCLFFLRVQTLCYPSLLVLRSQTRQEHSLALPLLAFSYQSAAVPAHNYAGGGGGGGTMAGGEKKRGKKSGAQLRARPERQEVEALARSLFLFSFVFLFSGSAA